MDVQRNAFRCYCGKCLVRINPKARAKTGVWSDDNHLPRAGAFIHTSGVTKYILLVQSYCGKWGPPKGTVESGESHYSCALRETYEETGLRIATTQPRLHRFSHKWGFLNILVPQPMPVAPQTDEISGYAWATAACVAKNTGRLNMPAKLALERFLT